MPQLNSQALLRVQLMACLVLVVFASTTRAGSDWVLSDPGSSCDDACSSLDSETASCNIGAINQINSEERMRFVDELLGGKCTEISGGQVFDNEPAFYTSNGVGYCIHLLPHETTNCRATFGSEQRYCCCGPDCPVSCPTNDIGWVLSEPGQTCDHACTSHGGDCNPEVTSNLDTREKIEYVAGILGDSCDNVSEGQVFDNEPAIYTYDEMRYCIHLPPGRTTTCETKFGSEERFCCCGCSCSFPDE